MKMKARERARKQAGRKSRLRSHQDGQRTATRDHLCTRDSCCDALNPTDASFSDTSLVDDEVALRRPTCCYNRFCLPCYCSEYALPMPYRSALSSIPPFCFPRPRPFGRSASLRSSSGTLRASLLNCTTPLVSSCLHVAEAFDFVPLLTLRRATLNQTAQMSI
jgi:hypothetical protein